MTELDARGVKCAARLRRAYGMDHILWRWGARSDGCPAWMTRRVLECVGRPRMARPKAAVISTRNETLPNIWFYSPGLHGADA